MRSPFKGKKYQITQLFGVNSDYYSQFGLKGHEGLDIVPIDGDWSIIALEDGTIVKDEDNSRSGAYGINCTIWHPQIKKATQYCHLATNNVSLNQQVKKGDILGKMGDTGNATGPHLHLNLFDVDDDGYRLNKDNGYLGGIDPLPFLQEDETQKIIEELRLARDRNWDSFQSEVSKNEELSKQVEEIRGKYENEQKHTIELNQQLSSISAVIEQIKNENKDYGQQILDAQHEKDKFKSIVDRVSAILQCPTTLVSILRAIDDLKKPQDEILKDREKLINYIFDKLTYKRVPAWIKSFKERLLKWLK